MTAVRELPLVGVRVVVFGRSLVGGLVGWLLADQGASVSFVCGVGGAVGGSAAGVVWQEWDLGDAAGVAGLAAVFAGADVVVDAGPVGVLAGVGLGGPGLLAVSPGVLVCSVVPFPGVAGSGLGECVDWVVAAELGLFRVGSAVEPMVEGFSVASSYAAVLVGLYVAAVLPRVRRSGVGGELTVSLFGAGFLCLDGSMQRIDPSFAEPRSNAHPDIRKDKNFPIGVIHECVDGRFIHPFGPIPEVSASIMRGLGHPEWVDEAVASIYGATDVGRAEWLERFGAVFGSRPAFEIERSIAVEGGAAAVCRTRDEWRAEPHAVASEIFVPAVEAAARLGVEVVGPSLRVGPAVRVFADAGGPVAADGPGLGGPGEGWSPRGSVGVGPLAGLRVLDLAIVLAGPTCGRLLAELGAEVIKVDAPRRAVFPYRSPYGWMDVNRGKRSVLLDVSTDEGRALLWELIAGADVVLENMREGKADALGFGFEAVSRARPGITYISLNAYDVGGEFDTWPGWEPNAQAATGMQMARPVNGRPSRIPLAPNDYCTGLLGAFGAVLAVTQARATGRSQHVRASLARTATFLQRECFDASLDGRAAEWRREDISFVRCADGWVVRSGDGPWPDSSGGRQQLVDQLLGQGIPAGVARSTTEVAELDWVRKAGLLVDWDHPHWGAMTTALAHGESSLVNHEPRWPAPDPGDNTTAILTALGRSPAQIADLIDRGIAANRIPLFAAAFETTA
ncbi:CoA transferase [Jatrophihabitans sp. DSM 45814]